MKTEQFSAARFRNAELISLGDDTIRICKVHDWSTSPVQALYTNTESSLGALKQQVNKASTIVETAEVRELDSLFNNSWRAAKWYCKAYVLSPVKAESDAATVLINLAKTHGSNLHNESLAVQNSNARLYLNDCETKQNVKDAIAVIKFQPFVDRIKLNLDNLVAGIVNRDEKASSEHREVDTKEFRVMLTNDLNSLYQYLELMSELNGEGEFTDMLMLINESIRKIEHSISLRSKQAKEEEVEEE
ncbi:DUF6261 family protein [Marinifilum sp. D737]|uniref:DUF6261 family protein n=1 Tax=Marinifilum sp. D737 TaxID=2969628 RepID=UPI002274EF51|nr:DUF6261 family protein [Marinifilum sp. D737]MCY1636128.1 DUF6261 family protein [Marinifilum sp. D737]